MSIRAINPDGSENPDYVEKKQWKPKAKREDYQPRNTQNTPENIAPQSTETVVETPVETKEIIEEAPVKKTRAKKTEVTTVETETETPVKKTRAKKSETVAKEE